MAYATVNVDFLKRAGNYNIGKQILDNEITLTHYIDCTVDALTSGATYKIFSVPAGFLLTSVFVTCIATESSDTLDIVDDATPTTTFVDDADLSAIGTISKNTVRKYYASAGFICILANAALTTAKVNVVVKGIVLNTSM